LGTDGPVWVDAVPLAKVDVRTLSSFVTGMWWWTGVKVALNAHFWIGGWGFFGVRSLVVTPLGGVFFLFFFFRFVLMLPYKSRLPVVWCLYGGFWAAILYHDFMIFVNTGIPSSVGYLYAVVACEAAIILSAVRWFPRRWQGYPMVSLTGLFLLLEIYATHFVL